MRDWLDDNPWLLALVVVWNLAYLLVGVYVAARYQSKHGPALTIKHPLVRVYLQINLFFVFVILWPVVAIALGRERRPCSSEQGAADESGAA